MGDFNETFLYHYTNEGAYWKILSEKTLLKSLKDRDGTNYRYGPGVYLTTLKPDTGRNKINKNNRDGAYFARKLKYADKTDECYFKFNKRNLPGVEYVDVKGGRDVWRFPNDIDLNKISFYHGFTDESETETNHYQQNNSSTTGSRYYHSERSFGHSRGNDVYGSSQQQQKPETSGLGLIAGTVAVFAIGAAALGLFFRIPSIKSKISNRTVQYERRNDVLLLIFYVILKTFLHTICVVCIGLNGVIRM